MNQYFPSARSTLLGLIIWGILFIVFGLSVFEGLQDPTTTDLIILFTFWIFTFLFMGVIWFGTGYYISDRHLTVRIGRVIHSRIELAEISEIYKTKSWIAAPANSLNRLAIKSGTNLLVMVSPEDTSGFIESITSRNPNVIVNLD